MDDYRRASWKPAVPVMQPARSVAFRWQMPRPRGQELEPRGRVADRSGPGAWAVRLMGPSVEMCHEVGRCVVSPGACLEQQSEQRLWRRQAEGSEPGQDAGYRVCHVPARAGVFHLKWG